MNCRSACVPAFRHWLDGMTSSIHFVMIEVNKIWGPFKKKKCKKPYILMSNYVYIRTKKCKKRQLLDLAMTQPSNPDPVVEKQIGLLLSPFF